MQRLITATLAIPFLASLGLAQVQYQNAIPLPGFGRTYYGQRTSGFTFQAPVDLTVVGLRVPDERGRGRQHVCLYRDSTPMPPWPATPASLTPVFFRFNEPSTNIISCSVPYKANEWFVVLGACATTIGAENCGSYAQPAGPYWTSIFGRRTTILRSFIHNNISTMKAPHPIYRDDLYEISRVEVYVTATVTQGPSTVSPGGTAVLALSSDGEGGMPYHLGSSLGAGPTWLGNRKLELSPDMLLWLSTSGLTPATFENYSGWLDSTGKATAKLVVPNIPALKGVHIYSAFVTLNPKAPLGIQGISNNFDLVIT